MIVSTFSELSEDVRGVTTSILLVSIAQSFTHPQLECLIVSASTPDTKLPITSRVRPARRLSFIIHSFRKY